MTWVTGKNLAAALNVKPSTVCNWRKRHPDFPQIRKCECGQPLYNKEQSVAWFERRKTLKEK